MVNTVAQHLTGRQTAGRKTNAFHAAGPDGPSRAGGNMGGAVSDIPLAKSSRPIRQPIDRQVLTLIWPATGSKNALLAPAAQENARARRLSARPVCSLVTSPPQRSRPLETVHRQIGRRCEPLNGRNRGNLIPRVRPGQWPVSCRSGRLYSTFRI